MWVVALDRCPAATPLLLMPDMHSRLDKFDFETYIIEDRKQKPTA